VAEPLHIGIDARELAGTPTGVGRYLAGVLHEWSRQQLPHRLTFFLHREPPEWLERLTLNGRVVIEPHDTGGTMWEQWRLPSLAARAGTDVLLCPAYTVPLRLRCPSVVVIHDVSFFAQPGGFSLREGLRRRWLTELSAKRAAAIVTVSGFSADEIHRHLGIPREGIVLAPQGAPGWRGGLPGEERAPIILYVGTVFNRRHIPDLLRAMTYVRKFEADARLIVVGANRTQPYVDLIGLAKSLELGDAFTWKEYVSDAELHELYATARVFAFLSDYEGYAMTPMEAASHGVPSVLLDTAVAREVYGDAAVSVPLDTAAIGSALRTLLTDQQAHARLVALGRARLDAFTWTRTADVLRETLERAAGVRAFTAGGQR
jgi:glycosyltransferase involved in cell wall biosynthesis